MSEETKKVTENIDDKLYTVKYKCDEVSHLEPNQELCRQCKDKNCTYFCPANVYEWDEVQNKLLVGFENCLECGACRIGCPSQSINWKYPKGGTGVTYRMG